jgi:hypothetical protein
MIGPSLVWTTLAIIGIIFCGMGVYEAWLDLQTVYREEKVIRDLAKNQAWDDISFTAIFVIFVWIGIQTFFQRRGIEIGLEHWLSSIPFFLTEIFLLQISIRTTNLRRRYRRRK